MREFLLIFILFGLVSPFAVSGFAQTEGADNISTNSTVTLLGNPLDDFMKSISSLIGTNKIDESLKKINRASLPQVDIKTITDQQGTATNTSTDDHIVKAAEEYTLGAGREKPSQMSNASTNLLDSLGSYLSGLFGKGSQEAVQFAGSKLPGEVIDNRFSSGFGRSQASVNENGDSKVLGAGDIFGSHAMGLALPLLQCANLPFSLCPVNGESFVQVVASPTPVSYLPIPTDTPAVPSPTSLPTPTTGVINPSYVYFSQYDSAWADHPFPLSCTTGRNDLKTAGCGPTSISMILSTFGNNDNRTIYPVESVDRFYQNEDGECDGTSIGEAQGILQQQGYETADIFSFYYQDGSGHWQANPQPISAVVDDLKNMIRGGWNIFGHANYWSDSSQKWVGHYFWITDVDDTGNIWVMDSWKGQGVRGPIDQNLIIPQPLYKAAFAFRKR